MNYPHIHSKCLSDVHCNVIRNVNSSASFLRINSRSTWQLMVDVWPSTSPITLGLLLGSKIAFQGVEPLNMVKFKVVAHSPPPLPTSEMSTFYERWHSARSAFEMFLHSSEILHYLSFRYEEDCLGGKKICKGEFPTEILLPANIRAISRWHVPSFHHLIANVVVGARRRSEYFIPTVHCGSLT